MRTVVLVVTIALSHSVTGCGSTAALDAAGQAVKVVEQPGENCKHVGTFYGRSHAPKYAINNLRNIVGENGGTHVAITNAEQLTQGLPLLEFPVGGNSLTISGVGYQCPLGG